MKKSVIITILTAVICFGVGFYGGMQYQKTQRLSGLRRQIDRMPNGSSGVSGMRGVRSGMQPVSGEIVNIDETGMTIKMPDGSSKIVFVSDSTLIKKASDGIKADLVTGIQVMAIGSSNSDGSLTAQMITIGGGFGMPPLNLREQSQDKTQ